jgi:Fe-S-cluster-containing hydrogenase components 1
MQYGMIIDVDRCVGCHACVIACKAEWEVPAQFDRNWVHRWGPSMTSSGMAATYYPGLCNHCNEPPCVPVCPGRPGQHDLQGRQNRQTVTMGSGRHLERPVQRHCPGRPRALHRLRRLP